MDKLFEAVSNRSYLPPSEQQAPVNKVNPKLEKDEVKKEEVICIQQDISEYKIMAKSMKLLDTY